MNHDRAETYADHSALLEEIARLRAELAEAYGDMHTVSEAYRDKLHEGRMAQAAIARVRELCTSLIDERVWSHEVYAAILRALDGAE